MWKRSHKPTRKPRVIRNLRSIAIFRIESACLVHLALLIRDEAMHENRYTRVRASVAYISFSFSITRIEKERAGDFLECIYIGGLDFSLNAPKESCTLFPIKKPRGIELESSSCYTFFFFLNPFSCCVQRLFFSFTPRKYTIWSLKIRLVRWFNSRRSNLSKA